MLCEMRLRMPKHGRRSCRAHFRHSSPLNCMPMCRKRTGLTNFMATGRRSRGRAERSPTGSAQHRAGLLGKIQTERKRTVNDQASDEQKLLRRALQGNAWFSLISGALILVTNRSLAEFLGLPSNASLTPLGIGLAGYAGWLLW